jgi:Leucine-rich repeat (LRR) protein
MGSNNSKTTAKSLDVGSKTGVIILSKKNFKSFPKPLLKQQNDQYTKVRSLDLSSNLIVHLNNINLSHFKSLKSLNLSKNKLTNTGDVLTQLNVLQNLDLSQNSLIALPPLPSKLQKLNVSYNSIAVVECSIKLPKLKEFDLSHNEIVGIASSVFKDCSLNKLERLNLSDNRMETIESTIGNLLKLVHLDVTNNSLSILPSELGLCTSLQTVLAGNNHLKTVPTELLENGSLSKLRLEKNNITKEFFLEITGSSEFMERRKGRIDREIHGGMHETDRSVCGLDSNN